MSDKDIIYRQAAIEEWKNDFKGYVNALNIPRDDYNGIMEYIDELPSAQPERKTGTWIFVRGEEAGNALYMCSECGKGDIHAPEVKVSYCWNCGAQMEGSDAN